MWINIYIHTYIYIWKKKQPSFFNFWQSLDLFNNVHVKQKFSVQFFCWENRGALALLIFFLSQIYVKLYLSACFNHTFDSQNIYPTSFPSLIGLTLWCLMPLSTIFQLFRGGTIFDEPIKHVWRHVHMIKVLYTGKIWSEFEGKIWPLKRTLRYRCCHMWT